jgi:tRNA(His) 5'-end guanylyltransferase
MNETDLAHSSVGPGQVRRGPGDDIVQVVSRTLPVKDDGIAFSQLATHLTFERRCDDRCPTWSAACCDRVIEELDDLIG